MQCAVCFCSDPWDTNHASHESFFDVDKTATPINDASDPIYETVIVATTPDSYSIQHFMDRTAVLVMSAGLALGEDHQKNVTVMSSPPRDSVIHDIYGAMGVSPLFDARGKPRAKRMVFSCRTPMISPYGYKRVGAETGICVAAKTFWF